MKRAAISLFIIFFLSVFLFPQNKNQRIDSLIQTYYSYGAFNGSILVAEKGEILIKKGFGFANMEWDIPNASGTKFRIGSVTKQFTSMIIMQLVQENKLNLNENISAYLPYYPKDKGDQITIHQLLSHTSGIPNYTNFPEFFKEQSRNPFSPEDFVKTFMDKELDFKPGSKWSYSNSGYFLLGEIIEKVTGKSYEENLQDRIFDPLNMENTGYDHSEKIIKNRAAGYNNIISSFSNAPYLDMSTPFSAGALYSTLEYLYKWDRALYTEKLLSKTNRELMFTPVKNNYGYGWGIDYFGFGNDSIKVIKHGGSIFGFTSLVIRLVDDESFIVLLSNTGSSKLDEISGLIIKILYDQPYEIPQKPLIKTIAEMIENESLDKTLDFYQKEINDGNTVSENDMNNLGYFLIRGKKYDKAEAIFNLNVEAYPESFNVYDSRGEALLALGRKEEAIKSYKKSLEINPRNENGIAVLKNLGVGVDLQEDYKMTPEIFNKYIGSYELNPSFIISISTEANKYYAQATNQPKLEMFPKSENKFYLKVVNAALTFIESSDGKFDKLILNQNGNDVIAKKIE